MNVAVIYCYPTVQFTLHQPMAQAFARTWREHSPGYPCQLFIGLNGPNPNRLHLTPFADLPYAIFNHDNSGWDIGLFQRAANAIACDVMVCLGAHIQFHHDGWLKRLVDALLEYGPGIYGPWGAQYPNWHIRTTAFCIQPPILQSYPQYVSSDRRSRYQFEHGVKSITRHALDLGFPAVMVTMRGNYPWPDWPNHVPTAAESIMLDKQHL